MYWSYYEYEELLKPKEFRIISLVIFLPIIISLIVCFESANPNSRDYIQEVIFPMEFHGIVKEKYIYSEGRVYQKVLSLQTQDSVFRFAGNDWGEIWNKTNEGDFVYKHKCESAVYVHSDKKGLDVYEYLDKSRGWMFQYRFRKIEKCEFDMYSTGNGA